MRFIPAGAGNTVSQAYFGGCLAVHPRRCGEHQNPLPSKHQTDGSSPQVRGTRCKMCGKEFNFRFIPAGAGNTISKMAVIDIHSVHPRRCGEHIRLHSVLTG